MAPMLPKLFFIHFEGTSFVAERDDGELLGFVCGFLSQTADDEAYIHFVGIDPESRGTGLGRALYERARGRKRLPRRIKRTRCSLGFAHHFRY